MMKYWMMMMLAGLTAVVGCFAEEEAAIEAEEAVAEVAVEESAEQPAAEPSADAKLPVAVVAFGDVDMAMMERAQKWASHNLTIPVPVLNAEPKLQLESFNEVLAAAEHMIPANQLGLVVVWRPSNDKVQNHGANFPDQRISVVNLNPMLTPDTDPEVIERRIERQVIRGICMTMGIEPSPNPMSAMFNYSSLEQLDRMGRNLDPPWRKRVHEAATKVGIELTPKTFHNN